MFISILALNVVTLRGQGCTIAWHIFCVWVSETPWCSLANTTTLTASCTWVLALTRVAVLRVVWDFLYKTSFVSKFKSWKPTNHLKIWRLQNQIKCWSGEDFDCTSVKGLAVEDGFGNCKADVVQGIRSSRNFSQDLNANSAIKADVASYKWMFG